MALPTSGPMSLAMLQAEFGGSNPINLSEYYRNGGLVPSNNSSVPASGTISLSQFYGAVNEVQVTASSSGSTTSASALFGSGTWASTVPKRLIIPSGTTLGSSFEGSPALLIDSGMGGQLIVDNSGSVQGAGGPMGTNGGDAIAVNSSSVWINNSGQILAGGGGGGVGGSGGAGGGGYYVENYIVYLVGWDNGCWPDSSCDISCQVKHPTVSGVRCVQGCDDSYCYVYYDDDYDCCDDDGGYDSGWDGDGGSYRLSGAIGPNGARGAANGLRSNTPGGPRSTRLGGRSPDVAPYGTPYYAHECDYCGYNSTRNVNTNGGSGGGGGAAGIGQGYNQSQTSGSSGTAGSSGGTNAGTGGTGGTGGSGGTFGNSGGNGATGQSGYNGNRTNGSAGVGGGPGGLAGYAITNPSNYTLNNNGTLAGRT